MAKTKNESIRFDESELRAFRNETGIESAQRTVDFLLKYWHTNTFGLNRRVSKAAEYFDRKQKIRTVSQYDKWLFDLETDNGLTEKEKLELKK